MDYSKYIKTVKGKLNKFGSTISITRKSSEVYDPQTNQYVAVNEVIEGKAIMTVIDAKLANGTSIEVGDVQFLCWFPVEPKTTDEVEFGGKKYRVVFVNPCNIDGNTNIMYEVQAR